MSAVTARRESDVLLLTINRPDAANAIDAAVGDGLAAHLRDAAADDAIAAVVLTGAGSRVFSAGADLKNPAGLAPLALAEQRGAVLSGVLHAVLSFPKPLVAAVNGAAIGAGAMLALLADQVIAAETARFALPEIDHAMPTPIGLAILSDLAGQRAGGRPGPVGPLDVGGGGGAPISGALRRRPPSWKRLRWRPRGRSAASRASPLR